MVSSKMLRTLIVVFAVAAVASGCSSAPDPPDYEVATKNRASQLADYGNARFAAGDYEMARRFFEQALQENISVDNLSGIAKSHNSLARVYGITGNLPEATDQAERALEFSRIADDQEQALQAHINLGEIALRTDDTADAQASFERARSIAASRGGSPNAILLHNLGTAYAQSDDLQRAEDYFDQARSLNEEAGNWQELASNYYMLASLASRAEDYASAQTLAEAALESDKKAEYAPGIAADLLALGKIRERRGDDEDAYQYYLRALRVYLTVNDARASAEVLGELEATATRLGRAEEAEEFSQQRTRIEEALQ